MSKRVSDDTEISTNKKKRLTKDEYVAVIKLEKELQNLLVELNTLVAKANYYFQEIKNRSKTDESNNNMDTTKIYDLDYKNNNQCEQKWMPYIT